MYVNALLWLLYKLTIYVLAPGLILGLLALFLAEFLTTLPIKSDEKTRPTIRTEQTMTWSSIDEVDDDDVGS